jgi:hypothetical protein
MPGLLDLPVELIDHIYDQYALILLNERPSRGTGDIARQLGYFRLTSLRIADAVRRRFLGTYFDTWHNKKPDGDDSIQRFCRIRPLTDSIVPQVHVRHQPLALHLAYTIIANHGRTRRPISGAR